jgi:hypothetical protein
MYGFAYMARGLALLAFVTVGCSKETELAEGSPDDDAKAEPRFEVIDYDAGQDRVLGRVVTAPGPRPLPGTGLTITETEPNSSMEAANQMKLGDDFFSNISFLEDSDYVRFTLTQRTQLSIHMVLKTLSTGFLVLYSSSGAFLAHGSSDDHGTPSPHIEITLEAGTYFIQAGTYNSESSGKQIVQLRQLGDLPPAPITHASAISRSSTAR